MTPRTAVPLMTRPVESTGKDKTLARRRYQKGSVSLRGQVWYGRYWQDVIEDGTRRRKYACVRLGTLQDYPTKRLALRALEPFVQEVNSPLYRARPTSTFEQFSKRWAQTVLPQLKPSTAVSYESVLRRHLLPYFGAYRLEDITPEVVQGFVASRDVAPKTARNIVMALRSLWKTAEAWGYVAHDAFRGIQLPKSNVPNRRYFRSIDDIRRIVEAADEPFKTLFWLAAETGLRAGELVGLRGHDIDIVGRRVYVRQSVWRGRIQTTKSARAVRVVSISDRLADHLARLRGQRDGDDLQLLFTSRAGTPLDPNLLVKRKLHPLLDKLGLPRMGLHAFRHTHSTLAHSMGVPLKVMQQRLGHATAQLTLDVYTHADSESERQFVTKLGEALKCA